MLQRSHGRLQAKEMGDEVESEETSALGGTNETFCR